MVVSKKVWSVIYTCSGVYIVFALVVMGLLASYPQIHSFLSGNDFIRYGIIGSFFVSIYLTLLGMFTKLYFKGVVTLKVCLLTAGWMFLVMFLSSWRNGFL